MSNDVTLNMLDNLPIGYGSENQLPPWMNSNLWNIFHHHHGQGNGLNQLIRELQNEGQKLKSENNPLGQQLLDLANQLTQAEGGQQGGWPQDGGSCHQPCQGGSNQNNMQLVQQLLTDASQLLSNNGSTDLAERMIEEALRLLDNQQPGQFGGSPFPIDMSTNNYYYL